MSDRGIKELSARHKQLARLLVGGHSQSQIAELLKVHKSTISRLVRDPKVSKEIERLQQIADVNSTACVPGISQQISEGAQEGIETLIDILADERKSPEILKLKANVALELLDRAGYAPIKQLKIEKRSMSAMFTPEEIEEIKRRGREAAKEAGILISSDQ